MVSPFNSLFNIFKDLLKSNERFIIIETSQKFITYSKIPFEQILTRVLSSTSGAVKENNVVERSLAIFVVRFWSSAKSQTEPQISVMK